MALSSCLGSSHSFLCYLWVRKHLDSIFELQQKWNEKIGSYFSFALVQLVGRGSFTVSCGCVWHSAAGKAFQVHG